MTAVWPGDLPQAPLTSGYSEKLQDNVVRSTMDAGPRKIRKRYTSAPITIDCTFFMDQTQLATFRTFYGTTLQDGSLPFEWTVPSSNTTLSFMFVEPPSISIIDPILFNVKVKLEQKI